MERDKSFGLHTPQGYSAIGSKHLLWAMKAVIQHKIFQADQILGLISRKLTEDDLTYRSSCLELDHRSIGVICKIDMSRIVLHSEVSACILSTNLECTGMLVRFEEFVES